jgi:putative hemolysin
MNAPPLPAVPLASIGPRRALRHAVTPCPASDTPRSFETLWARTSEDVRAAQRLRHQVFVQEMGARLRPPVGTPPMHEADLFDPFCEHLLVRTQAADSDDSQVIGTYRVLTPNGARRVGSYYADTEFDLTRLRSHRSRMVELGRSCVHPDWRSGGVILALWTALGQFMTRNGLDTMIGCASVGMLDGGHHAASLWSRLRHTHLAPIEWQVNPRCALPINDLRCDLDVEAPALIKGYLRCGARLLGAPAWDADFNTADLPLLLRLGDLAPRYRQHFER